MSCSRYISCTCVLVRAVQKRLIWSMFFRRNFNDELSSCTEGPSLVLSTCSWHKCVTCGSYNISHRLWSSRGKRRFRLGRARDWVGGMSQKMFEIYVFCHIAYCTSDVMSVMIVSGLAQWQSYRLTGVNVEAFRNIDERALDIIRAESVAASALDKKCLGAKQP